MSFLKLSFLALLIIPYSVIAQPTRVSLENFNLSLQKLDKLEKLGIVISDQREQVVDGRQKSSLLGYTRSVTGIAYPATIKTKESLAEWISGRSATSYNSGGLPTVVIKTSPNEKWPQIEAKMKSSNINRFIVLQIRKLQFDGIVKFSYMAELDVEVYSGNAELLKSIHVSDEREMGGVGGWKKKFPLHLVSIIEDAINNPEIFEVLNQGKNSHVSMPQIISDSNSDLIITKKGDEIKGGVEEITSDVIKYTKASQPDGPLRNIPISDVFMVKYKDGTKEVFD